MSQNRLQYLHHFSRWCATAGVLRRRDCLATYPYEPAGRSYQSGFCPMPASSPELWDATAGIIVIASRSWLLSQTTLTSSSLVLRMAQARPAVTPWAGAPYAVGQAC